MKSFYNGKNSADIAKRNKARPKGPTHEQTLRKLGFYDRGREWFRLEVK